MKYCKAYPIDIRITKEGVTLNDLEHTMLSLFWEKDLNEIDKDYLLDCYKTERMQSWMLYFLGQNKTIRN